MSMQSEINVLRERIAKLEAKLNKPKKFEPLSEGHFIYADGIVTPSRFPNYANNPWNCFPTKEDAERRQKLREAEDELYNLWLHITGGWEPDWNKLKTNCYFVPDGSGIVYSDSYIKAMPNYRYYQTKEQTQQAIDLMSDHAKWYLRKG